MTRTMARPISMDTRSLEVAFPKLRQQNLDIATASLANGFGRCEDTKCICADTRPKLAWFQDWLRSHPGAFLHYDVPHFLDAHSQSRVYFHLLYLPAATSPLRTKSYLSDSLDFEMTLKMLSVQHSSAPLSAEGRH